MIFNYPKYCPIIKVDLNKFMNTIFEGSHHYLGKYRNIILESKGHHRILEAPPLHCKGCLMSIFLRDSDLKVSIKPISERIKFLTHNTFKYLISKRNLKMGHLSKHHSTFLSSILMTRLCFGS